MNRRYLLKGFVSAVATVAVGIRLAKGMPTVDLKDAVDTFRWEFASDNYWYGIDTAEPWHVEIWKRIAGDDWESMKPLDLVRKAQAAIVNTVKYENVLHPPEPYESGIGGFGITPLSEQKPNHKKYVTREAVEDYGFDDDLSEEFEVAATISVSQAILAINHQGGFVPENIQMGVIEMDDDAIPLPGIYTTREELLRHG